MNSPTLIYCDPSDLVANPFNPNVMSPENERRLDQSLRRRKMFKPIVVRTLSDGRLEVLGGQHRVESAIRLNFDTVPVFNLGEVPDDQAKEICLIDNNRYGTDDTIELARLLESLNVDASELATFLPYSEADLSGIFSAADINLDDLLTTEDEEQQAKTEAEAPRTVKTHQIMRFKVPVEDAGRVTKIFDRIMKLQGFTESDALTNAGDALVHMAGVYEAAEGGK